MYFGNKRNLSVLTLFLLIIFVLTMTGCPKRKRTPNEQLVVDRLKPFWRPLEEYKTVSFTYPDNFFDICNYAGLQKPINPYTGQPMIELDSLEFDPDVSPGNIYYIKVTGSEGIIINCQVAIFGEFGEITRYHHAGPSAAL